MSLLLNKETGQVENLPDQQVPVALQSGSHGIPLVSPQGDVGSAPSVEDARRLVQQGFAQPNPEQVQGLLEKAHYQSTPQRIIAGAEQLAKGAAGPLATGAELIAGVNPKDIVKREENLSTGEKMLGQGAGLLGSMFIPGGQGKILAKVGEGVEAISGLTKVAEAANAAEKIGQGAELISKAPLINRIGSQALKAAAENAVFQAGDELSKKMLNDPNQTAETAMTNIGLAGVIGGGTGGIFGTVPELWKATSGPKTEAFLGMLKSAVNGEAPRISEDFAHVIAQAEKAGVTIPPEMRAGLSENPYARDLYERLRESGTASTEALKHTIADFQDKVAKQMSDAVAGGTEALSAHEAGEQAKQVIMDRAEQIYAPIRQAYAEIAPHAEAIEIPPPARNQVANQILQAGRDFGAAGSPQQKLFENYAERVGQQSRLSQLDKLMTEVGSAQQVAHRAGDFETRRALASIKDMISEFQDNRIEGAVRQLARDGAPESAGLAEQLIADRRAAKTAYHEYMNTIGDLSGTARLGKIRSHGQLMEALEEIPSAKLADKLFDKKNIEGLTRLQQEFPGALDPIIQQKRHQIIEAASRKGELMHNQVLNSVNALPKEIQQIMFKPEELQTINSAGRVLREVKGARINPSGTAGTLAKLMEEVPTQIGSLLGYLTHGALGGVLGGVLGKASKLLSMDVPDAARMAILKYIGSGEPISAGGFKAAVEMAEQIVRGDHLVNKATKAVFKAGQEVLPKSMLPDEKSRKKLEKKLLAVKENPGEMLKVGGEVGHYMPEHAQALAQTSMNAVNYLNGLKPATTKLSPLDKELELSPMYYDSYHRALDIAQSPLIVLDSIKDGTLTLQDTQHLAALYPNLQANLQQKLLGEISSMDDHSEISYPQRISLSLFLGQPLESTLTPEGMKAIQEGEMLGPKSEEEQLMESGPAKSVKISKGTRDNLKSQMTGPQAREYARTQS